MKLLRRFHYNAPVTLTFSLVCLLALGLGRITSGWTTEHLFMTYRAPLTNPLMYVRLFGHAIGHASWQHFLGNILYILMLGPMLEEKYGSKLILEMMCLTALVTVLVMKKKNKAAVPSGETETGMPEAEQKPEGETPDGSAEEDKKEE